MAESSDGLTLEGLAQILRGHMDGSAARFAEVGTQFAEVRASIQDLRGEVGLVATLVRDLSQIVLRQVDEVAEHRQHIRQIFSRMEQQDARFEAVNLEIREMRRDIRRILDAMERRGGDGGRRES